MKQARIINANGFHCIADGTLVSVGELTSEGNYLCSNAEAGHCDNTFIPGNSELRFREAGDISQYVPVDQLQFI